MDTATILTLVTALEQMAAGVYQIVQKAGLSPDETQVYIDRIKAAIVNVPEPCVGTDCAPCNDGSCG